MNRREFFKAFVPSSEKKAHVRPPYSDEETDFSPCRDCDAPCVEVCETGIMFRDEEGAPALSFTNSGCSFCGACAESCGKGVLSPDKPRSIRAEVYINPKRCSAWQGVLCFSCKEPCLDNAIRFEGLYKPVVLKDKCSSCGFCIPVCPTGAIEVKVHGTS